MLFFWSDLDFGISFDTDDLEGLATIALIVIVAVDRDRRARDAPAGLAPPRCSTCCDKVRAATAVLRSPTKVVQLFGGNLLSQVLFAVALGACARAFGEDAPAVVSSS